MELLCRLVAPVKPFHASAYLFLPPRFERDVCHLEPPITLLSETRPISHSDGMSRQSRVRPLDNYETASEAEHRSCEWPDCDDAGEHRAPRSRHELGEYRWFCLDHAREYNKAWNYYRDMSEQEVEADRRRDTVWERPSWPLGSGPGSFESAGIESGDYFDPLGILGGNGFASSSNHESVEFNLPPKHRQAAAVLGLEAPVTTETVKARYKELVKQHHPDANGGDATSEDKIREINQAYQELMEFFSPA